MPAGHPRRRRANALALCADPLRPDAPTPRDFLSVLSTCLPFSLSWPAVFPSAFCQPSSLYPSWCRDPCSCLFYALSQIVSSVAVCRRACHRKNIDAHRVGRRRWRRRRTLTDSRTRQPEAGDTSVVPPTQVRPHAHYHIHPAEHAPSDEGALPERADGITHSDGIHFGPCESDPTGVAARRPREGNPPYRIAHDDQSL